MSNSDKPIDELSEIIEEWDDILQEQVQYGFSYSDLEFDGIIKGWWQERVEFLQNCLSSEKSNEKAHALLYFDHDVSLPEDLGAYESFWDIPEKYFEFLSNVNPCEVIKKSSLLNPLNHFHSILAEYYEDPDNMD